MQYCVLNRLLVLAVVLSILIYGGLLAWEVYPCVQISWDSSLRREPHNITILISNVTTLMLETFDNIRNATLRLWQEKINEWMA